MLYIFVQNTGDENTADIVDQSDADLTDRNLSLTMNEMTIPALGKHWKSICALRLRIQKQCEITNANSHTIHGAIIKTTNERTIRILKSNQYPLDTNCTVHITNSGII